ncbi:head-tail adaptor protein [Mesorhizobium sp. BR1-1-9]|uniref:head-tail adaptor protein n=1 Tax=Mesorhizobium sp. BR1-1-9 TaxID=2876646 RepID=UPI001CD07668|nr:head-tail adaptor protein [Mesorhizobium sp. BR1-1-9]MBZ9873487.1 head-tail adaptor protein [Mesorhizobium sp. BR1-1-9]
MAKRSGAGSLNWRVTFQTRAIVQDEYNNDVLGEFADVFTIAARLQPKFGTDVETVTAARLAALQPYNLTVRSCAETRAVTPAWRVYDARKGMVSGLPVRFWNIKTVVNPDERGQYLEMLIVEGESS